MNTKDPNKKTPPVGHDGTVFRCPQCKAILPNTDVPSFPFCSDRCRLIDLGNWMEGRYTLSRPVDPSDNIEDIPSSSPPRINPPTP